MSSSFSPERWAFDITHVLNAALGAEHFPIDVPSVAREISAQKFPDDPILRVVGENLPGFDGALYRAPAGKKGWGIFYNNAIRSRGRINFTLGHEFGHYLLHRIKYHDGFECGEQDVVRWDSELGQVEHQANVFAANLLMPLDDFRRQSLPRGVSRSIRLLVVRIGTVFPWSPRHSGGSATPTSAPYLWSPGMALFCGRAPVRVR